MCTCFINGLPCTHLMPKPKEEKPCICDPTKGIRCLFHKYEPKRQSEFIHLFGNIYLKVS
jgi:hypothetical protein